ncbi:DUF397 domain-containing protein [Streptomyces sp. NPDC000609]|uniref:DUF397 domain-containing protein n=1 Tax=Streptomyces sp. NPDC000609 TaxID=3160957 RepID=UPI003393A6C2
MEWRTSSYSSNSSEADCVEAATAPGGICVRDSENAQGARLDFTSAVRTGFVPYAAEH